MPTQIHTLKIRSVAFKNSCIFEAKKCPRLSEWNGARRLNVRAKQNNGKKKAGSKKSTERIVSDRLQTLRWNKQRNQGIDWRQLFYAAHISCMYSGWACVARSLALLSAACSFYRDILASSSVKRFSLITRSRMDECMSIFCVFSSKWQGRRRGDQKRLIRVVEAPAEL